MRITIKESNYVKRVNGFQLKDKVATYCYLGNQPSVIIGLDQKNAKGLQVMLMEERNKTYNEICKSLARGRAMTSMRTSDTRPVAFRIRENVPLAEYVYAYEIIA